jgi:hypothetical protein
MAANALGAAVRPSVASAVIRIGIVALTLGTAWIHLQLGGWMFVANAIGYGVLAIAMVLPGPIARIRWMARLALLAFTAATIGGWMAFGARFELAYLDKAMEAALVGLLLVELWRDGGAAGVVRHGRQLLTSLSGRPTRDALR